MPNIPDSVVLARLRDWMNSLSLVELLFLDAVMVEARARLAERKAANELQEKAAAMREAVHAVELLRAQLP